MALGGGGTRADGDRGGADRGGELAARRDSRSQRLAQAAHCPRGRALPVEVTEP